MELFNTIIMVHNIYNKENFTHECDVTVFKKFKNSKKLKSVLRGKESHNIEYTIQHKLNIPVFTL